MVTTKQPPLMETTIIKWDKLAHLFATDNNLNTEQHTPNDHNTKTCSDKFILTSNIPFVYNLFELRTKWKYWNRVKTQVLHINQSKIFR